ncbi:MAG: hypothetical protein V2A66_03195 [Pseudomonadota bacterium]
MQVKGQKYYFLASVIFLAGIALSGFILSRVFVEAKNVDRSFTRFLAPGTHSISLEKPGGYTVYFESKSELDGKVYISNDNAAAGLKLKVKEEATGADVRVSITGSKSTYSLGSREGISLLAFYIERPGRYEVNAEFSGGWGEHEKIVLAVGQGFTSGIFVMVGLIFCLVMTLIVAIAVPTVLIVVALTKKSVNSSNSSV